MIVMTVNELDKIKRIQFNYENGRYSESDANTYIGQILGISAKEAENFGILWGEY